MIIAPVIVTIAKAAVKAAASAAVHKAIEEIRKGQLVYAQFLNWAEIMCKKFIAANTVIYGIMQHE